MYTLKAILTKIISFFVFLGLINIIFSLTTDFSIKNLSTTFIEVIYDNANMQTQGQIISILTENCQGLDDANSGNPIAITDLCSNNTAIQELTDQCTAYYSLKNTLPEFESNQDVEKACSDVLSGKLNESCKKIKESPYSDQDKEELKQICSQYMTGKLNNRTFFIQTFISILPENILTESTKIQRTLNIIDLTSKILFLPFLFILVILNYKNKKELVKILASFLVSLGMTIVIPTIILKAYALFGKFDSSSLLNSLANLQTISINEQRAFVISITPLIMNNIIEARFLITGIIILITGLLIKRAYKKRI